MTRSRLLAVTGVVAALLVAAGLLLALSAQRFGSRAVAATGSAPDNEILAIARQDAVDFTTYDYRHLAADFRRFAARTTGQLHTQYTTFAPDLEAKFTSLRVQASGTVVSAGIGQRTARQVTVLVAVDNTIHNKNVPKGQVVYDRLAFVLQRVGNQWLASEVHEL